MLAWSAETGLHEKPTEFVAIQTEGSGFVVDLRSADVRGRVAVKESFVVAVLEQPRHRRQSASDGGLHPTSGLHLPAKDLDVSAFHLEKLEPVRHAPRSEQTKVGAVADEGCS
jgi:hypothetical protein